VPKTVYFAASSVDGYIATPDHSLDWLLSRDIDQQGPMGPDAFVRGIGALAMGASTYRWIRDHQESWEYTAPTWVFTHRDLSAADGAAITFTQADVTEIHGAMARAAGDRDLWVVGGGELAGQFADAHLLDEVVIAFAPVTLGAGAPLLPRRLELRLTELVRNGDFACTRYDVVREA
jgi:dihydrofolate reductase